ncbi:DUF975 family protein [Romboutsia sp.]|uniref:DUF975 family protein n=1 Tax=Romboutsia sp. TaxID=1965302 RepID=UPI002D1405F0|nr:DUF975 family protein [Romboutsia sp.]HSQ87600.1 DUF975 family protein [Romboutsia sp.]
MKSFSEIKSLSTQQFKSNWKLPVLFSIITLILTYLANYYENGNIIINILVILFSIYSTNLYLNIVKYNECSSIKIPINKLFKCIGFSILNAILMFVLSFVLIFVSTFVALSNYPSALIFIILTLIFITVFTFGIYLSFSLYLILDMDYKVFESVKYSFLYMNGNVLKTLWLYITFIPWVILGAITLGLGFLYIMPYLEIVYANYYIELKNSYNSRLVSENDLFDNNF